MRRYFKSAHEQSGLNFVDCKFEHSFRSGEAILAAVDLVFEPQGDRRERHIGYAGFPPHIALPDAAPSVVEIWEPEKPDRATTTRKAGTHRSTP